MKLVFIDTESAGLEPHHATIQIAAIATEDFEELDSFEVKIEFSMFNADEEALLLNSYDAETWKREAVPELSALRGFQSFLYDHSSVEMISKRTGRPYSIARLAGHNAERFDSPRIQAMFKRHGQFLPAHPQVLDTCQLALWKTRGELKSYKLADLCTHFGINSTGAHDALVDVRMCAKLAKTLMEMK